jgi:hypothetical protein
MEFIISDTCIFIDLIDQLAAKHAKNMKKNLFIEISLTKC